MTFLQNAYTTKVQKPMDFCFILLSSVCLGNSNVYKYKKGWKRYPQTVLTCEQFLLALCIRAVSRISLNGFRLDEDNSTVHYFSWKHGIFFLKRWTTVLSISFKQIIACLLILNHWKSSLNNVKSAAKIGKSTLISFNTWSLVYRKTAVTMVTCIYHTTVEFLHRVII